MNILIGSYKTDKLTLFEKSLHVILFFLLLTISNAFAQTYNSLSFESLNINNGLSQGFISSIKQDSRGLMWFATSDGLNKYDGSSFTIYHHDPDDSTSIGSDDLTSLFEDSKGRLWIGTRSNGLDLFDRENNVFRHIRHGGPNSIWSNDIQDIKEDRTGALWIRTKKGIDRLEISTRKTSENSPVSTLFPGDTFLFTHIKLDSAFEARKDKYGSEKSL